MEQARIAQLLMRHRTGLYAYLRLMVRNPHDAEDLLQDVALAASRSAGQYREGTPFTAWVREIARRRVLDFCKKRGRRPFLVQPEVLASLDAAAATLDAEAVEPRREALRGCLEKLAGPAREILDLRYAGRAEVGDIARRVGRSVQATYAVLKRAKQILRDCVERRLAGDNP